ncbi:MAG: glycosyltransferase family 2 protein [Chloroflexota bacterium]|nr:glycosyltransferase [Dehalococcoidia bacterium]MDW8252657.1 glycosyltransferase family 2 protein [Chloroflexota bacterium]
MLTLSIITPSYNHGRFIEQTILSVVNQDYPKIEYLVIDGGSTDETVEILRRYSSRITYWVSEPDEGHRYALKKGFDRATGEIVAWQNADDYYEPWVFGKVMRIFHRHPEIDLVYGNIRLVDEHSREIDVLKFVPLTRSRLALFDGLPFQNHAAFFRRRLWDAIGGIRFVDYNFDTDLIYRAARIANARFIPRILGNYRAHLGSQYFSGAYRAIEVSHDTIRQRYLGSWKRLPRWTYPVLSAAARARRFGYYVIQGDWDYLLRRVTRRLERKRSPFLRL